jgi:hypothetical protein
MVVVVMVMRRIWSRRQKGRLLILPRLIDRHVVLCRRSKCGAQQQNRQMPKNNILFFVACTIVGIIGCEFQCDGHL